MKRSKSLDALRVIFCLSIFFNHCDFLRRNELLSILYERVLHNGLYGVTFFFLVSAYCMYKSYSAKSFNRGNYIHYIYCRIKNFYPLYITTMLPYAIIQLLKDKNVLKVMLTFLLSTTMLQTLTIKYWGVFNSAAWYLSALFVLYAIFPILLVIVKAIPRSLTVIAIMIIITIIPAINLLLGFISNQGILSVEIVGLLTQKWPIYWIPVYFAGMMIAKLDYSIQDRAASILEIITIFIVLICYFSGINGPIWLQNYKLVLYMLSGLLLIIVFAQEKGKISQWLAKSKISKFSNYTLEIYLIHYPVSQFFYFMFPSIPKSIFGGIIEVISIFLITCILSFTWKKMIHTVARRKIDKKNE